MNMGSKSKKLQDIVNVGIGAVKTSQEVWQKLMSDLDSKKEEFAKAFSHLREEGEKDFSDSALKIKVGAAWSIVRFEELKDRIVSFFNQSGESNPENDTKG